MTAPRHLYTIGDTVIEIHDGWTMTRFDDGCEVHARHDDCQQRGQAKTAADLGYPDVATMSREHDLARALLAHWLGLAYSPVLSTVALAMPQREDWWKEEAAVLALQRYAVSQGLDLLAVAERHALRLPPEGP